MYYTIDLLEDRSELVRYDWPTLPVYAHKGRLSNFQNMAASSHWHADVEFIVPLEGHMAYNVNGEMLHIEQGEGLFINAKQLHYGFADDGTDCLYLCVLLHPAVLCGHRPLAKSYVSPLLNNESMLYRKLDPAEPWAARTMALLETLYQACDQKGECAELSILSVFFELWSLLYRNLSHAQQPQTPESRRLASLRAMVRYVQEHFGERVTTKQIADAGCVCQTSCCNLFRTFLHQQPIQYVVGYRLNRSAAMLLETDAPVTEIALACGFTSISYFTETFRQHFGCPPTEYRRRGAEAPRLTSDND